MIVCNCLIFWMLGAHFSSFCIDYKRLILAVHFCMIYCQLKQTNTLLSAIRFWFLSTSSYVNTIYYGVFLSNLSASYYSSGHDVLWLIEMDLLCWSKLILHGFSEVYIRAPSKGRPFTIREVKASYIGQLVRISGIVTRCSDVKPLMQVAVYTCEDCGFEIYQVMNTTI